MSSGGTKQQGSGQSNPYGNPIGSMPTQMGQIQWQPLQQAPNPQPMPMPVANSGTQGLMGLVPQQPSKPSQMGGMSPSLFNHIQQMGGLQGLFNSIKQRRQMQQWGSNGSQIPPWQQPQPMSMQQPQQPQDYLQIT